MTSNNSQQSRNNCNQARAQKVFFDREGKAIMANRFPLALLFLFSYRASYVVGFTVYGARVNTKNGSVELLTTNSDEGTLVECITDFLLLAKDSASGSNFSGAFTLEAQCSGDCHLLFKSCASVDSKLPWSDRVWFGHAQRGHFPQRVHSRDLLCEHLARTACLRKRSCSTNPHLSQSVD